MKLIRWKHNGKVISAYNPENLGRDLPYDESTQELIEFPDMTLDEFETLMIDQIDAQAEELGPMWLHDKDEDVSIAAQQDFPIQFKHKKKTKGRTFSAKAVKKKRSRKELLNELRETRNPDDVVTIGELIEMMESI